MQNTMPMAMIKIVGSFPSMYFGELTHQDMGVPIPIIPQTRIFLATFTSFFFPDRTSCAVGQLFS